MINARRLNELFAHVQAKADQMFFVRVVKGLDKEYRLDEHELKDVRDEVREMVRQLPARFFPENGDGDWLGWARLDQQNRRWSSNDLELERLYVLARALGLANDLYFKQGHDQPQVLFKLDESYVP